MSVEPTLCDQGSTLRRPEFAPAQLTTCAVVLNDTPHPNLAAAIVAVSFE